MYSHNYQKNKAFYLAGHICECYFGLGFSIKETALLLKTSSVTVSKAISRYLHKPVIDLSVASRMDFVRHYKSSVILDLETGIYYDNAAQLSRSLNQPLRTIQHYVNGDRRANKRRFIKT